MHEPGLGIKLSFENPKQIDWPMKEVVLKTRQVVGRQHGPHLLITAGVHGDEFEPMLAIRRLIGQLDAELLRGRVTLVPVVNEAAFLRGQRTAEDELDLARTCPGRPDGTITERTAHALSELIRTADLYIDLHTGGTTLSVLPMVGYKLHANSGILEQQRGMAHAFNLPVVWGTDPNLEGRSLSVARDAGVPAIYAEYLGAATCCEEGVQAYVEGCFNVMGFLNMIQREPPKSRIEISVEDRRPSAGHMQICNPAPMTGFFEPAVKLGDRVTAGVLLGTVTDVLGETSSKVVSNQTGTVLVLRTFCRVLKDDALAVILEQ